jgi:hypothetical protein
LLPGQYPVFVSKARIEPVGVAGLRIASAARIHLGFDLIHGGSKAVEVKRREKCGKTPSPSMGSPPAPTWFRIKPATMRAAMRFACLLFISRLPISVASRFYFPAGSSLWQSEVSGCARVSGCGDSAFGQHST